MTILNSHFTFKLSFHFQIEMPTQFPTNSIPNQPFTPLFEKVDSENDTSKISEMTLKCMGTMTS